MLRGAIAAALTPLTDDGAVDEAVFDSYLAFLASHGIDGVLALGTTGEGVLFGVEERKRIAELFVRAAKFQVAVIASLRERATTFVGLKVSETPWERFEPYLLEGVDIFVGPEALIPQAFARGATGAVSGLAASFPDAVSALVREPTPEAGKRVGALRASLQALPFQAASKT